MSQQQPQQSGQAQGFGQQTFEQFVPESIARAVYQLEQFETDVEWAHGQAMQTGEGQIAQKLEDIEDIVHVQKSLLIQESPIAATMSQCTQQALQQCQQQLQTSQTPGVQQIVQQIPEVSQAIQQATSQVVQSGQSSQMATGTQTSGQMPSAQGSSSIQSM